MNIIITEYIAYANYVNDRERERGGGAMTGTTLLLLLLLSSLLLLLLITFMQGIYDYIPENKTRIM
jgi:hypothetical protein